MWIEIRYVSRHHFLHEVYYILVVVAFAMAGGWEICTNVGGIREANMGHHRGESIERGRRHGGLQDSNELHHRAVDVGCVSQETQGTAHLLQELLHLGIPQLAGFFPVISYILSIVVFHFFIWNDYCFIVPLFHENIRWMLFAGCDQWLCRSSGSGAKASGTLAAETHVGCPISNTCSHSEQILPQSMTFSQLPWFSQVHGFFFLPDFLRRNVLTQFWFGLQVGPLLEIMLCLTALYPLGMLVKVSLCFKVTSEYLAPCFLKMN